jgi:hypothetical protein
VAFPFYYLAGCGNSFPGGKVSKSIKLTIHLHLMSMSAVYGAFTAVLPINHHGVLFKHMGNLLCTANSFCFLVQMHCYVPYYSEFMEFYEH